jgi:hypothetical protein
MIPSVEFQDMDCPFAITDEYDLGKYYITPGCLVYVSETQAFYDPCKSTDCDNSNITVVQVLGMNQLSFDPRASASGEVLGTWPLTYHTASESGNQALQDISTRLKEWYTGQGRDVPWRLSHGFVANVVMDGGKSSTGSTGNTASDWGTSEGFARDGAAEFCDSIADWWPHDWTKPVGYHVTVPCDSTQTGYRTFDAAFAIVRGDDVRVTMRYQHNLLRDPYTFQSQYGTTGFCRRGMYGMPQFVTNTMRVCTRDAINVEYDATVPVLPKWNDLDNTYGEEYCSTTPYEVPWTVDDATDTHPSMFSTGNTALWRGDVWNDAANYPSADRLTELENTHPGIPDNSWGESCTDGDLLYCSSDDDCVGIDEDVSLECFRNTCILFRENREVCYRHEDCQQDDKFCSGVYLKHCLNSKP